MATNFAHALFANQVRATTGGAGLVGIVAGLAFNRLLKRHPVGAVVFGVAILSYQAYRASEERKALREAAKALALGSDPASKPTPPPTAATPARRELVAAV